MQMRDVLTKSASETRVMVKQYRFHPRTIRVEPAADVWLDSGNLADWLGDAIYRVEWVAARNPGPTAPHGHGQIRFEAYLDGDLIGEIRDDAGGRTYYALA